LDFLDTELLLKTFKDLATVDVVTGKGGKQSPDEERVASRPTVERQSSSNRQRALEPLPHIVMQTINTLHAGCLSSDGEVTVSREPHSYQHGHVVLVKGRVFVSSR